MSFLTRLLERLVEKVDGNLLDSIPAQRPAPDDTVVRRLPPARQFEVGEFWSHCRCCLTGRQPCLTLHRLPCDGASCGEPA